MIYKPDTKLFIEIPSNPKWGGTGYVVDSVDNPFCKEKDDKIIKNNKIKISMQSIDIIIFLNPMVV